MLEHGGRLREAARRYSIPEGRWLDLSTGINPLGWPVPPPPDEVWRRLPEEGDELLEVARGYYGTGELLPVAGSQAAIQLLPRLRPPSRVALLAPAYAEHERAWREAGHEVTLLGQTPADEALDAFDVVVAVNPNNPSGRLLGRERLLAWHERLAARGSWLVVDEAFMDAAPDESLAGDAPRPGLVVLRSLGKFFGLAGLRVGFVLAERPLLVELEERLGPWAVSHPARWVAARALNDRSWQAAERERLTASSERLARLLADAGLASTGGCALFHYVESPRAAEIADRLAREAILVRRFGEPSALRFGLPGGEVEWARLGEALNQAG